MDPATLSLLTARRTLNLRIPRSTSAARLSSHEDDIDGIEATAEALRRSVCARAAAARAGEEHSSSDELEDLDDALEDESDVCATLRVQTLPVAASIGGKVWDASLLFSTWICAREEHSARHFPPAQIEGRAPRLLELGSGLGLAGLAAAFAFPTARVTCSDYDPAVLDNLHATIRLNTAGLSAQSALPLDDTTRVDVARVDFRDFTAAGPTGEHPEYARLLHQFDLLFAADVVYEQSHCNLARVCLAMLRPPPCETAAGDRGGGSGDDDAAAATATDWEPRAIFMLPDSRPRLREFVNELGAAGLRCRIERVRPSPEMVHHRPGPIRTLRAPWACRAQHPARPEVPEPPSTNGRCVLTLDDTTPQTLPVPVPRCVACAPLTMDGAPATRPSHFTLLTVGREWSRAHRHKAPQQAAPAPHVDSPAR